MVIGSFNDAEHPMRALLVSEKVANNLVFKPCKGILAVKARLLGEPEWRVNKDCVYVYESVYLLKSHISMRKAKPNF